MVREYIIEITDELDPRAFERVELLYSPEMLIRCKDCKYYSENQCMAKSGWFPVTADWFCADGERREQDG